MSNRIPLETLSPVGVLEAFTKAEVNFSIFDMEIREVLRVDVVGGDYSQYDRILVAARMGDRAILFTFGINDTPVIKPELGVVSSFNGQTPGSLKLETQPNEPEADTPAAPDLSGGMPGMM